MLFLTALGLVGLAILVGGAPRVLGLYYQLRAGELLADAGDPFQPYPVVSNPPLSPKLAGQAEAPSIQAIQALLKSIQFNPMDSHTYLLLGRAYLLAGQPDEAIEAYAKYTDLRPANPLGHLELGFAYEAQCHVDPSEAGACRRALREWEKGGLVSSEFASRANVALKQRRWTEAVAWYRRYRRMVVQPGEMLPDSLIFRETIAVALAEDTTWRALLREFQARDSTFQVHSLAKPVRIDGDEFRWLNSEIRGIDDGTRLSEQPIEKAGTLGWSGQATALVFVENAGSFELQMRLRHNDPPPVEMAVGVDSQQIEEINLGRGDGSWEEIRLAVQLTEGFHTIDIWFLNNGVVDGKDRDASVQWVSVDQIR